VYAVKSANSRCYEGELLLFHALLITGRFTLKTKMHATCIYDASRKCEIYDTCAFCMLLSSERFVYFYSHVRKDRVNNNAACLHVSVPENS
jgi:hypothetical protein